MIRKSRLLCTALTAVLVLATAPASSDTTSQTPVIESVSSGLITFSREERAIRVAAVFVAPDRAVVPTLVKFLDQAGNVLKQVRGDLSEGNPVVAELTRADVAGRGDLLVRVEVLHKFPGLRRERYSILVSTQPIGPGGSGSLAIQWNGGTCGTPTPPEGVPDPESPSSPGGAPDQEAGSSGVPAPTIPPGAYLMCLPSTHPGF